MSQPSLPSPSQVAPPAGPRTAAPPVAGQTRPRIIGTVEIDFSQLPLTALPAQPPPPPGARGRPVQLRSPNGVLATLGTYQGWWRGGRLTCEELDLLGVDPRAVLRRDGLAVPARFEAPRSTRGASRELVVEDGWFDASRCSTTVERRSVLPLREIVARALYATLTERDLVLVFLHSRNVATSAAAAVGGKPLPDGGYRDGFARVALPRSREAEPALIDVDPGGVEPWLRVVAASKDQAARARKTGLVVTVELAPSGNATVASALAHVSVAPDR